MTLRIAALAGALLGSPALAQSNVNTAHKHTWGENIGYIDWECVSSAGPNAGAMLMGTFLAGRIWSENCGWISLGDGTPGGTTLYTNANGSDHGVNVSTIDDTLNGYAWGENIGWINFSGGGLAAPPNPARLDPVTGRLRGYAWGENVGWINLDDANVYVEFEVCPADFNGTGGVTVQDIYDFLAAWNSGLPSADFNGTGGVTVQDIYDFLAAWNAGCP